MNENTNEESPSEGASKPPESSTPEALYSTLVSIRNTELTVYWTRYNIQSAINFVFLAAVLTSGSDSFIGKHIMPAAVIGLVLAIIWLFIVVKGKELLTDRWERHIRSYEESTNEVKYKLFCEVKKEEGNKSKIKRAWDNLDIIAPGLPILCMVAWIVILTAYLACKS
jgi:hypothetical protein